MDMYELKKQYENNPNMLFVVNRKTSYNEIIKDNNGRLIIHEDGSRCKFTMSYEHQPNVHKPFIITDIINSTTAKNSYLCRVKQIDTIPNISKYAYSEVIQPYKVICQYCGYQSPNTYTCPNCCSKK